MPATTVWGYGAVKSASKNGLLIHNAPSLTIESKWNRPVRIKWINDLKDANSNFLPHLLPVGPRTGRTRRRGTTRHMEAVRRTRGPPSQARRVAIPGPVPIVTHVHGAVSVGDESDGYAEAWYLPDAAIPRAATEGTWY